MRILAGLALLVVVACGGSKHEAQPPDTRQVIDPSDGVPGEENNYCCCQVAKDPVRYDTIAIDKCERSGRKCLPEDTCVH